MSLNSIMVDRSRIIKRSYGARVRGESQIIEEVGEWIKCRIDPDTIIKTRRDGKVDGELTHQFICLLKDAVGNKVVLEPKDRIEIEKFVSAGIFTPQGIYEISTVSKPRSVRRDILIVANVKRLLEF
jgi:hypothetical protein